MFCHKKLFHLPTVQSPIPSYGLLFTQTETLFDTNKWSTWKIQTNNTTKVTPTPFQMDHRWKKSNTKHLQDSSVLGSHIVWNLIVIHVRRQRGRMTIFTIFTQSVKLNVICDKRPIERMTNSHCHWLYWWWTCMPTMFSSSAIMGSFTNLNLSSIISSFFRILCITCQLALGRGRGCYWLRAARVSDLSQWRRRTQRAWSSCSPTWRPCGLCLGFEQLQTWLCRHRCRQSSSTPGVSKNQTKITQT